MTQNERLDFLLSYLSPTNTIPKEYGEKWTLFRALVNTRHPTPVSEEFLKIQNDFLKEEITLKGITDSKDLSPYRKNLYLWQGDITTLKVDAIVNAANSALLGCFIPCHACIDNAIHTFSGVQLRLACNAIIEKQGQSEATGRAKITEAFNLPSKYVLHTVGPIVSGELTTELCELLASCYRSCLELVEENKLESIAFCCISTGEFHFPKKEAAKIAIATVEEFLNQKKSNIKVIFNVFSKNDYEIYQQLL